jgi:hypothetical protein
MKSIIKSRLFFLVIGISALLVIVTYLHGINLDWSPPGLHIILFLLTLIQIPSFVIASVLGALIHKNPHNPVVVAYFISLFITYLLIFWGLIALFRFAHKWIRKN